MENIGIAQPLALFQRINAIWPISNLWLSMVGCDSFQSFVILCYNWLGFFFKSYATYERCCATLRLGIFSYRISFVRDATFGI